jgi:predicted secreted protein
MVQVTLDEAAGSAKVPSGQQITVTVSENPTTGHRWKVEAVTGPLSLVSSVSCAAGRRTGQGGTRTIVVQADRRGPASCASATNDRSRQARPSADERSPSSSNDLSAAGRRGRLVTGPGQDPTPARVDQTCLIVRNRRLVGVGQVASGS